MCAWQTGAGKQGSVLEFGARLHRLDGLGAVRRNHPDVLIPLIVQVWQGHAQAEHFSDQELATALP